MSPKPNNTPSGMQDLGQSQSVNRGGKSPSDQSPTNSQKPATSSQSMPSSTRGNSKDES